MTTKTAAVAMGKIDAGLRLEHLTAVVDWFKSHKPENVVLLKTVNYKLFDTGQLTREDYRLAFNNGEIATQLKIVEAIFNELRPHIGEQKKEDALIVFKSCAAVRRDSSLFASFGEQVLAAAPAEMFVDIDHLRLLIMLTPGLVTGMEQLVRIRGELGRLRPELDDGLAMLDRIKHGNRGIEECEAGRFLAYLYDSRLHREDIEGFIEARRERMTEGKIEDWREFAGMGKFEGFLAALRDYYSSEYSDVSKEEGEQAVAKLTPELFGKATALARFHAWRDRLRMDEIIGDNLYRTGILLDNAAAYGAKSTQDGFEYFVLAMNSGELQAAIDAAEKMGLFPKTTPA